LDEPVAGLSAAETSSVMAKLKRIRDQSRVSVLLVEHNMKAVMGICDRVSVLNFGKKIAEGPPEAGLAYFAAGTGAVDMAALAWALEETTRQFYARLADMHLESGEVELFRTLVQAEEHHKETLAVLNEKLTTEPVKRIYDRQDMRVLEGGMDLEAALRWVGDRSVSEILDMAMGLESNAYDRYLKMLDISEDDLSKEVFRTIAVEEKGHLKRLADLMDKILQTEAKH